MSGPSLLGSGHFITLASLVVDTGRDQLYTAISERQRWRVLVEGISVRRFTLAKLGLAALVIGAIAASIGLHAGDVPKKIRVIYTNDTLGYLEPCG